MVVIAEKQATRPECRSKVYIYNVGQTSLQTYLEACCSIKEAFRSAVFTGYSAIYCLEVCMCIHTHVRVVCFYVRVFCVRVCVCVCSMGTI